jgi:hypothetical protein
MGRLSIFLTIGLVLVLLVIPSSVFSENTPLSLVLVSGDASVLSSGENGTYQLMVNMVDQNATVTNANLTSPIPLEKVLSGDISNAALVVFDTDGNETAFMVQVSAPLYSVENKTLSMTLLPHTFYNGTMLAEYSTKQSELLPGEYGITELYIECPK